MTKKRKRNLSFQNNLCLYCSVKDTFKMILYVIVFQKSLGLVFLPYCIGSLNHLLYTCMCFSSSKDLASTFMIRKMCIFVIRNILSLKSKIKNNQDC